MRLDRLITLNLVQPLRKSLIPRRTTFDQFLPVLMYHSISDGSESSVRPYYRICTDPERFCEQMQWLKDHGYRGVTLNAGLTWLSSKNEVQNAKRKTQITLAEKSAGNHRQNHPSDCGLRTSNVEPRAVAITFDDGLRDFYTHAFPILQQHGFSATMYLPTAFIGQSRRPFRPSTLNSQLSTGRECLTWTEVRELYRTGIEFGSHTVHHPELVHRPWPEIESEIADSKRQIENQLGVPVKTFAYPYAFPQTRWNFVGRLKDLLMFGGYETCVTTLIGRHRSGADPLEIKRLPVNSGDDVRLFQAKLEGGYDWLALAQRIIKNFKQRIPGSGKRNNGSTQSTRSLTPALDSRNSDF